MSVKLKILPLSELDPFTKQQCIVPNSSLQDSNSSNLYKCEDSGGNLVICEVFASNSVEPGICFLDTSVSIKCSNDFHDELVNISPLEISPDPEEIQLEVTVNQKIFPRGKQLLSSDFIKYALGPFYLVDRSTVVSEDMNVFGVSAVVVSSPNTKGAFKVNENTKLTTKNVILKKHQLLLRSELGGVQRYYKELESLVKTMTSQNKLAVSHAALVVGPTGCGKTSICNNFFLHQEANVFCYQAADLLRQYPGETEEVLRTIFQNTRQFVRDFKPKNLTVIFFENVDVLCPSEESANSPRITSQLTNLLDDCYSRRENILIIATTNNSESVDYSLKRNGRFSNEIVICALDEDTRRQVLDIACKRALSYVPKKVINSVAKKTPGYVGTDIVLLVENVYEKSLKASNKEIGQIFEKCLQNVSILSIRFP